MPHILYVICSMLTYFIVQIPSTGFDISYEMSSYSGVLKFRANIMSVLFGIYSGQHSQKTSRHAKVEAGQALFTGTNRRVLDQDSAICYVTGWLARTFIQCQNCKSYLTTNENTAPFIRYKAHCITNIGLISPSPTLLKHVKIWESIFRKNILRMSNQRNIRQAFVKLFQAVPLPNMCSTHSQLSDDIMTRFATFRLHAFCRFTNLDLKIRCSTEKKKLKRLNALY